MTHAPSGYELLASANGSFAQNVAILTENLEFDEAPNDFLQEIQVQLTTAAAAVIEITLDGTNFVPINNGQQIFGLATFTFLITNADL